MKPWAELPSTGMYAIADDDARKTLSAIFLSFGQILARDMVCTEREAFDSVRGLWEKGYVKIVVVDGGAVLRPCMPEEAPQLLSKPRIH